MQNETDSNADSGSPGSSESTGGFTFRTQLLLSMSGLVLVTAVIVALVAFAGAAAGSRELADALFRDASAHAVTRARHHVLGAVPVVSTLAQLGPANLPLADSDKLARVLVNVLEENDGLTWLSFSDTAGTFTGAYRTSDGTLRLNQSRIENGKTRLIERDVLADGSLRVHLTDDDNGYDPRARAFFTRAREEGRLVWLPPYVFFGTKQPGITVAVPIRDSSGAFIGVFTADFDLNALSKFIGSLSVSGGSRFFLYTDDGVLLAHPGTSSVSAGVNADDVKLVRLSDLDDPLARAYLAHRPADATSMPSSSTAVERFRSFRFEEGGTSYLASSTAFRVDAGVNWVVGALAPEEDFIAPARRGQRIALVVACTAALAACAVAALVSRRVSRPVMSLTKFMRRVGGGDLEARADLRGPADFRRLSSTLNEMIGDLRDRLRIRHALNVAMEVQQRLLPSAPPTVPGLDIAGHSTYCDETGGDYYDFIMLDRAGGQRNALLVALGDVMGHGVASALVMSATRAVLRDRCVETGSLADLLGRLNELIYADLGGGRFMTMYLAVVDADAGTVRFASAGHDPAIVYDPRTDKFEEVDEGGLPLGVTQGADGYREAAIGPLHAGQVVFIGTDGIWEMKNPADEEFGKDRLRELIRSNATQSSAEISRRLQVELDTYRGDARRDDDVTFIVLKVVQNDRADGGRVAPG